MAFYVVAIKENWMVKLCYVSQPVQTSNMAVYRLTDRLLMKHEGQLQTDGSFHA